MSEELKEETAPVTEKEPTPQELKVMRRNYLENRKKEVEMMEVETRLLELQIKHYDYSIRIKEINDEIKAKRASEEFKSKITV